MREENKTKISSRFQSVRIGIGLLAVAIVLTATALLSPTATTVSAQTSEAKQATLAQFPNVALTRQVVDSLDGTYTKQLLIPSEARVIRAGDATGATIAARPAATFPGTGTGAIPDSPGGTPPVYGTPLVISYAVTGVTTPITDVSVSLTATHSWVGDLDVQLAAPGGAPSFIIFSRVGVTAAGAFGTSSDLAGTYVFSDTATGTNFWTAAAATPVPVGTYRTTAGGGPGQTNPAPVTNLTAAFAGLTTAQANGTWTLTVRDGGGGDTGSVTASSLSISPTGPAIVPPQHVLDFNGDGKTDYSVVRNTGGGSSGQVTWFNQANGGTAVNYATPFGIASDFFVPADYDGDGKTDIAVWRPGAATVAAFYILQSATNTLRVDAFGQTGDDPTVVGDYTGDGKADPAVYRAGASAGAQSIWFYRASSGALSGQVVYNPWGQSGDFPAPGDYDGDGKGDFVVQRTDAGNTGQARFFLNQTAAGQTSLVFGTPTDVIVPGDYDGDGKTDIATVRGVSGVLTWNIRNSSTGNITTVGFGASATDFQTQGDYNGDGKTDIAVWRPNTDPTQNYFYVLPSGGSGLTAFEWGQNGDYPVANFNAH